MARDKISKAPPKSPRRYPAKLLGSLILGLLTLVAASVIIITMTNKDDTVTKITLPEGSRIEVNGKTINTDSKKTNSKTINTDSKKTNPMPPGPLSATYKNGIGMEFVKVPKGTAWLGGTSGSLGQTKVVIDQDFYLGKYEVTQEEGEKVTGLTPSEFKGLKRFPVENVSWNDCQVFLEKLNKKENESGWVYRLPKESEWEYACRGGPVDKLDSAFDFYFAKPTNTLLPEQANFDHGLMQTCKVGSYEPNILGLFDMHGNVWEWCDVSEEEANGTTQRGFRGGGWNNNSRACIASFRLPSPPRRLSDNIGLRVARFPSAPAGK